MILTPQAFHNLDITCDIFNHSNIHFWEWAHSHFFQASSRHHHASLHASPLSLEDFLRQQRSLCLTILISASIYSDACRQLALLANKAQRQSCNYSCAPGWNSACSVMSRALKVCTFFVICRYMQPGADCFGFISCTGTNFLVRSNAFRKVLVLPSFSQKA